MQKSRTCGQFIARAMGKQTARCMKLTALVMLVTCMHVTAKGISQDAKVTVASKQITLGQLLKVFEKQTNYHFSYSEAYVPASAPIAVDVSNADMFYVLQNICDSLGLVYRVMNDRVIALAKAGTWQAAEPEALPPADSLLQVKGRVVNEDGEGIAGASVYVRLTPASPRQTRTDSSGYFELKGVTPNATLVVIRPDFVTGEFALRNNNHPLIRLQKTWTSTNGLDNVVVVGYGVKKKEYMSNAVSSINAAQITEMPATNLSQVFAGRIPGILARTSTGSPGDEAATLLVRTSFGSQAPLLVVDGVPRFGGATNGQTDLNSIDPNEVESISVLKDNAAAAVYGARAANGVILITTKRGKTGRAQFSYTTNFTWSSPTKLFTKLDGYGIAVADNEYAANSGLTQPYSTTVLDTIHRHLNPYVYANTDWAHLVLGSNGLVQNHNFNIQGGNELVRYFYRALTRMKAVCSLQTITNGIHYRTTSILTSANSLKRR